MRFRTATEQDVPAIVRLVNDAYRGTGGWTTEAHLVEGARAAPGEIAAMLAEPGACLELALADGEDVLGCVFLRREDEKTCYLGMLSVDPGRQAGGIGSALMEHAERAARAWGCASIRIRVIETRAELLAYYERRGYARTGRLDEFPVTARSRPKVDGLRFAELVKPL